MSPVASYGTYPKRVSAFFEGLVIRFRDRGRKTLKDVFAQLLEAFRHDHVMLGRGFNELSNCLRAGDAVGACAAARRLHDAAGAHIGFEEEEYYPALVRSSARRRCGGCVKSIAAA